MLRSHACFHLLLSVAATLFFATTVAAQLGAGTGVQTFEKRDFKDTNGDELIFGQLESLKGSKVKIVDDKGAKFEFDFSDFSVADREWIKTETTRRKMAARLDKERNKLVSQINSNKPNTIITACNRLRAFGDVDSTYMFAPTLKGLWEHEDQRVRQAAFVAYIFVARKDDSEYTDVLRQVNQNVNGLYDLMSKKPRHFLEGMALYRGKGLNYIRHVAFSGEIKADPRKSYDDEDPAELILTGGTKSKMRAEAVRAMAGIKTEESLQALVELLDVVAAGTGDERDENSLKAIIKAIGEVGIDDDNVRALLEDHQAEYPDLVGQALESMGKQDDGK